MQFDEALAAQDALSQSELELGSDWDTAVELEETFSFLAETITPHPLAFCNHIGYILSGDPWIQAQRAGKVFWNRFQVRHSSPTCGPSSLDSWSSWCRCSPARYGTSWVGLAPPQREPSRSMGSFSERELEDYLSI